MAIVRGQVDRFGNPIPPNQSVKIWINSDGSVPQQRETVKLDASIVATDDAATQATQLTLTGAAASAISSLTTDIVAAGPGAAVATIQPGVVTNAKLATAAAYTVKANVTGTAASPTDPTFAGALSARLSIPELIGPVQTLSAASSYTSVSFVAETYKELILKIDATDAGGGTTFGNMTLNGLTGTGNGYLTTNIGATNNIGIAATIFIFSGGSAADIHVETNIFPLNTGRRRKFQTKGISIGSTASWYCHGGGDFPDTTHGVTAVAFGTTALTGTVELWGIRA